MSYRTLKVAYRHKGCKEVDLYVVSGDADLDVTMPFLDANDTGNPWTSFATPNGGRVIISANPDIVSMTLSEVLAGEPPSSSKTTTQEVAK